MIQFSINKNLFLHALNTTKRAIQSKNAVEILSTIKIEVSQEGITLTGSNGEISIENFISIDDQNAGLLITETGGILFEANFFINVISSLPEINLDFKELDHHQVLITSGKSEITLKGKDIDLYPRIAEMAMQHPLTMNLKQLKEVIAETSFAASQQESRPILTGVHFTLDSNMELTAIATDSHRLSQRKVQLEQASQEFDVVIPSRSLKEISSVFSDDLETIELFFSSNQILFRSENISLYTRLLEGVYPDTSRLLKLNYETNVTFNTSNLQHTMERAHLLSNLNEHSNVKLELKRDGVRALVQSPEVGKFNEEIDFIDFEGEELTISFNTSYMIAALKALKSESVVVKFVSSIRPFVLVPGNDSENYIQLITPVRTN